MPEKRHYWRRKRRFSRGIRLSRSLKEGREVGGKSLGGTSPDRSRRGPGMMIAGTDTLISCDGLWGVGIRDAAMMWETE